MIPCEAPAGGSSSVALLRKLCACGCCCCCCCCCCLSLILSSRKRFSDCMTRREGSKGNSDRGPRLSSERGNRPCGGHWVKGLGIDMGRDWGCWGPRDWGWGTIYARRLSSSSLMLLLSRKRRGGGGGRGAIREEEEEEGDGERWGEWGRAPLWAGREELGEESVWEGERGMERLWGRELPLGGEGYPPDTRLAPPPPGFFFRLSRYFCR
mmetsp:Transcript_3392/g.6015  ORF Transcript_3392/g.6015 Transcript_3392/m.6015 type:complete len:210 (-) Transcript_3392:309-938(-)